MVIFNECILEALIDKMKILSQILASVLFLTCVISCESEELQPENFISVTINGEDYTFLGRSIYEPKQLFGDTLHNTTYLGGFIGSCEEGSHQFFDLRMSQGQTGEYNLEDGIRVWLELESEVFLAKDNSEGDDFQINIQEYGDENGRIAGQFSGTYRSGLTLVVLERGTFSLQRLPNHSGTFEVAGELCR